MPSCSIRSCHNNSHNTKNKEISYLCFPKDEALIEKWKVLCKENVNPKIARVCSQHFHPI
ncbi:hypothetical protein ALC62_01890 [Cyphomyrmex costatus]|uniref:THAP-type domain-containing protein n=1 Tax=Cyphomyrmex costatus TaxID=456900 RepID=A0A151INU5_9HYME|nr:hypothetical protein ALC62_01890 [Cyphomyrmex costatus]